MSKTTHTQKHMTLSDQIYIKQASLNRGDYPCYKKDVSSISKWVRKHKLLKEGSQYPLINNCAFLSSCQHFRICQGKLCPQLCRQSKSCDCTKRYPSFILYLCYKLKNPPYVCNGCSNRSCRHDRFFYRAKDADSSYKHTKGEFRESTFLRSGAPS